MDRKQREGENFLSLMIQTTRNRSIRLRLSTSHIDKYSFDISLSEYLSKELSNGILSSLTIEHCWKNLRYDRLVNNNEMLSLLLSVKYMNRFCLFYTSYSMKKIFYSIFYCCLLLLS